MSMVVRTQDNPFDSRCLKLLSYVNEMSEDAKLFCFGADWLKNLA